MCMDDADRLVLPHDYDLVIQGIVDVPIVWNEWPIIESSTCDGMDLLPYALQTL